MNEITPSGIPSAADPVPVEFDLICEHCGYSLIGLMHANRCPECGREFDPNELPLARVPWLYRKQIGFARSYVMTAWQVTVHPMIFAAELCRPVRVSQLDARSFRRITVLLVTFSIAATLLVFIAGVIARGLLLYGLASFGPSFTDLIVRVCTISVGMSVGLWCWMTLATNLPTFIWKGTQERPNDLVPIHHYASAPLALAPLFGMAVLVIAWRGGLFARRFDDRPTSIVASIMVATMLCLHWTTAAILMRVATHCTRRRTLGLLTYLPVHWFLMGLLSVMIAGLVGAGLLQMLRLMGVVT